jgi:hypothetical protein
MFDIIGPMFFSALRRAADHHLERNHPCLEVLDTAVRDNSPAAIAAAQEALAALAPAVMAELMADAHKLLREDPGQILRGWTPSGTGHRH